MKQAASAEAAIAERGVRLEFGDQSISTPSESSASRMASITPRLEKASRIRRPIRNSSDR